MRVVFCRTAQHRGTADVYVLDRLLQRHALLGHGFFKGIKIDHHQIDRRDTVLLRIGNVPRIIAAMQKTAMHHRMQSLQPAFEKLGRARVFGNIRDPEAGVTERLRSAPGRE